VEASGTYSAHPVDGLYIEHIFPTNFIAQPRATEDDARVGEIYFLTKFRIFYKGLHYLFFRKIFKK